MAVTILGHLTATHDTWTRVHATQNTYGNGRYYLYVWPTQYNLKVSNSSDGSNALYVLGGERMNLGLVDPYNIFVQTAHNSSHYYGAWLVPAGEDIEA